MKICKQCGAPFEGDSEFCIFCGGKLAEEAKDDHNDEDFLSETESDDKGKNIKKSDTIKKIGVLVLAVAAFFALVLTVFMGQSVKYSGKTRNADPSAFSYFSDKNMLDYLTVADDATIRQTLENSGIYVTDALIEASRAISVTQTVAAVVLIACMCGFIALAVVQTIYNFKNKFKKIRLLGYIGAVVSYICGAFIFQTIESGQIAVVYKTKLTKDSFNLLYGLNTVTVLGLVFVILFLFAGLALLIASDMLAAKKADKGVKKAEWYKSPLFLERVVACIVAVCALFSIGFASSSALTSGSKGTVAVYYKNETTGVYESVNYVAEKSDNLTLISLVQKYSLEEEEILYNISLCEAKIKVDSQDIESMAQLTSYNKQLDDVCSLLQNALNFGLTTVYVNIALIVFAGVLACFVICGRRVQKGDLLIGVSVAVAFFAFLGCLVTVFVMVSFAQKSVSVFNVAPFFHLLFSAAALVAAFYTRKFLQINVEDSQGDKRDVTV